ncbi:hypothetical protein [uncultured Clostridium sp.]|uniref:hypothetical protein n=1 Tax=uncultured Clostridium sp. TaxID=59620 RepID=UPI00261DD559|nr:hypothetical protein [uncultured Clostridium sp.]
MVTFEKTIPLYRKALQDLAKDENELNIINNKFKEDKFFRSLSCINITDDNKLIEYYNQANNVLDVHYAPFGIFVTNNAIYTACSGNGTYPWCMLSDDIDKLQECFDRIKDMYLDAKQPCCRECMLTCRHLQKCGYTCFDKKKLEVSIIDNKVDIKEIKENV